MARGSLASARNPNAAITARYPSARATIAALTDPNRLRCERMPAAGERTGGTDVPGYFTATD